MKNKKISKKRGELTSSQLVIIILAIIGFAIILVFYNAVNWKGEIDKEACHQSIVYRSSFKLGPAEASTNIPLKCATEKICLTMSGQDCEQYPSPKEAKITKIKLDSDLDIAREKIKDVFAEALLECNSILGEGKLDFMPHEFLDTTDCIVCSRIVFDKEVQEKITDISYNELYNYMEKKTIPGKSISYLDKLYGTRSAESARVIFETLKQESTNPDFKNLDYSEWKIKMNFESGYIINAKMIQKGTIDKWKKVALIAGVAAAGVYTFGTGVVGTAIIGTGGFYGSMVYIFDHPNDKYQWVAPNIHPYDIKSLKDLSCNSFESAP